MKKFLNSRIMMLVLVVAMVFAMSVTAFADTNTVNVKVQFTSQGNPIWNTSTPINVPMGINITLATKSYFTADQFNSATINPLGTKSSVMDAIIAATKTYIPNKAVTTGVDLAPKYGNPGAYIKDVGSYTSYNQYDEYKDDNGQWWGESVGAGWSAYITPAGGTETSAAEYLSRIQLHEGDKIRFDYSTYDYTWKIDGPTTK
ncbi:hypothetical protein [Aminipila terrae]|uniref:DUF4430 domain-containing protein n=1 Tax=Aminipila terrae TaxID=2697030 RepID=A0A6P1MIH9_9FIRM|nr:hypothetical protein [Aminipila terrae]QHI71406.1 hypothetical protein Ami3637_02510 [Aminipila terrae]